MHSSTALLATILAVASSTAEAAEPTPPPANAVDPEARAAAEAMVERFVDSWNRADGAAYGENYWPDAELVDPSGAIHEGRAAIVNMHVELWAGPFKGTRQAGSVRRIRMLCPSAMVVDFDAVLSGVRGAPPGVQPPADGVLHAHLKHVMQKRSGQWKVIAARTRSSSLRPGKRNEHHPGGT